MQTWETSIYRENNIYLMKCHIAVVIFYLILGMVIATVITSDEWPFLLLMPGVFVFLHSLLAYGSYRKLELSRKASVVAFVFLAIGTAPVGFLLAVFLLMPATQWQTPKDS
jgi:hypothetical protein